jgi:hypothetical protein
LVSVSHEFNRLLIVELLQSPRPPRRVGFLGVEHHLFFSFGNFSNRTYRVNEVCFEVLLSDEFVDVTIITFEVPQEIETGICIGRVKNVQILAAKS